MSELLSTVGHRLRRRRLSVGLTVRELAEVSGLSARYIISAEAGQANLSLTKLDALCRGLQLAIASVVSDGLRGELDVLLTGRTPDELNEVLSILTERFGSDQKRLIALLGVRGAGKSAVGSALARHLNMPVVELDREIEERSGLSLAEMFALHGEPFYRRMEFEALSHLQSTRAAAVLATGGGIVTDSHNFDLLKRTARTVWLKATAEDHWERVIRQGDRRPMANHPQAMAELRRLLEERAPLYGHAELTIDTSGRPVSEIVHEIMQFFGV